MKRTAIATGLLLIAGGASVYWAAAVPAVVAIHPETDRVPANFLRFYVDFSEPMAGDDVFDHVRLLDASGHPIPDAFREIELWSRGNRRLMCYIHPGRVKTGLALGEQFGPVIEEGKTYTLEILPGMKARNGRPVRRGASRPLRVGPPDRESPDLSRWTIAAVPDRVQIDCDKWLDHAGLEEFVQVEGVAGRIEVDGRRVTFLPAKPLVPGDYRLVVDARLEDWAGNSFIRPFETVSGTTPLPSDRPPIVARGFSVR